MMKRFLCGVMATALVVASVGVASTDADAATKVPKAKYTFNMNKKNKKVVAVARKGENSNYAVVTTNKGYEGGSLPKASNAKKVKLKYKKGKHGKALYLDRKSSYGAQLKGVKLGSKSWTVSFWVKPDNNVTDFMSIFFTGSNITNVKKTKWLSITKASWLDGGHTPTIWSHNASLDKGEDNLHFPWFSYQNADGDWLGAKNDAKAMAINKGKWSYVTLVVDTKDTCEYGKAGENGYVKSYHAWCYVNGELYGNGTVAKNSMSNKNLFFLGINAWDTPFKGYFDDVQFWNKALKAKQVKALYKKMK